MRQFTKQLLLASLLLLVFGCRQLDDSDPVFTEPITVSDKFYSYQGNDPWVSEMIKAIKKQPYAGKLAKEMHDRYGEANWGMAQPNMIRLLQKKQGNQRAGDSENEESGSFPEMLVPVANDNEERVNAFIGWRRLENGEDLIRIFDRQIFEELSVDQLMERQPRLFGGHLLAFENRMYGKDEVTVGEVTITFDQQATQDRPEDYGLKCDIGHLYVNGQLVGEYWFNCEALIMEVVVTAEAETIEPDDDQGSGGYSPTYFDPQYREIPYYQPGGGGTTTDYSLDPNNFPENPLSGVLPTIYVPDNFDRIHEGPRTTSKQGLIEYLELIANELEQHEDTDELSQSIRAATNNPILDTNDLFIISMKAREVYLETRLSNFNIDLLSGTKHTSLAQEAAYIELYPELKEHVADNGWPLDAEQWEALWEVFKPLLAEVLIEGIPGGGITLAFRDLVQGAEAGNIAVLTAGVVGLALEFFPAGKFFKVVRKAGRAFKKGFKVVRHALKHLSTIARAMKKGLKLNLDGPVIKLTKNGDEVARISNNILEFNYSGFGGKITTNPNKTTTVIGKWQDPTGGGTAEIIESGVSKSGKNNGGINALSEEIPDGWNDDDIWNNVNEPWLQDAINRNDDIRAVSDPRIQSNIFKPDGSRSFYGKEVKYLEDAGYVFDPVTSTFKK